MHKYGKFKFNVGYGTDAEFFWKYKYRIHTLY